MSTITEDFEWGVDGDPITDSGGTLTWSRSVPGTCLAEIDTAQAYAGTRSLGLCGDGTNFPKATVAIATASYAYSIRFRARYEAGGGYWRFWHGGSVYCIFLCAEPTAGKLRYYGHDGASHNLDVTCSVNTWYLVEMKNLDFTGGYFDLWFGGVFIARLEMWPNAGSSNKIELEGHNTASWSWFDEFEIDILPGFPYEFPLEFGVEDGVYCYIDWDNDGDWSAGHENVSQYLRSYSVKRGKDSNMGRAQVGTAQITLKDVAGTYIPSSTVSSLAGLILPGRKVKIQRNYGGVEYVLFTGYLDDIQNDYADTVREAYFSCTDGSERLAKSEVREFSGSLEDRTAGKILRYAFDWAGWSTGILSLDTGGCTYPYVWPYALTLKTIVDRLIDAEDGLFYVARDGMYAWENRDHRTTYHSTSEWTCPGTVWRSLKTGNNWKGIVNGILVKNTPRFEYPSNTTAWENPENALNNTSPLIEASCSRGFWVVYTDINGNRNEAASASYYKTADTSSMSGGVDKTASVADTVTSWGDSAYWLMTNNATSNVYIVASRVEGRMWTNGDEIRITSEDTGSQDAYGVRDQALTLEWAPTSSEMQAIADNIIANNSSARPTYIVELVPNSSDALTHALDLDISDRFTLQDSRISLSRDVYIDQVQHSWNVMDGVHHTYWTVSCAT